MTTITALQKLHRSLREFGVVPFLAGAAFTIGMTGVMVFVLKALKALVS